jgi:oligoendopeptidase F
MALSVLPKVGAWNLDDLVKDPNGNEFQEFLKCIKKDAADFGVRCKELHDNMSISDFENLLHLIENITERISIASGYAQLRYSADTSSNEAASLVTKMDLLESDVANRLISFDLWFKKGINEENARRLTESAPFEYKEYLKHKRLLARHTLTEPEEKIINTLEVTGTNALIKIYDRMTSGFEFLMTTKRGSRIIKKKFSNKEKMLSHTWSKARGEKSSV